MPYISHSRDGQLFLSSNYKSWEREFGVGPDAHPWSHWPKHVGSSRTNMVVKILPVDGDNRLLVCGFDRHPISPIRINSSSSVAHTESFTPYPLHLSYISYCPCMNSTLHPCYRCNSLHSPHCFMPLGLYSDCSLYLPSLSFPPPLSAWQAPLILQSPSGAFPLQNLSQCPVESASLFRFILCLVCTFHNT